MTTADLVEQFTNEQNHKWLTVHGFFMGNNGTFAVIREVSESSHDILMGDIISSDASAMDVESQDATEEASAAQPAADAQPAFDGQPAANLQDTAGSSRVAAPTPGTLLGAGAPPGLLAIEDAKPDEYYQASDQIRGALNDFFIFQSSSSKRQSPNWLTGFIPLWSILPTCGCLASMP